MDSKSRVKQELQKNADLKIKILKLIGQGLNSRKKIIDKLSNKNSKEAIYKAIPKMEKKKWLEGIGDKKMSPPTKDNLKLTEQGLENLMKYLKFDDFWKITWYLTDKTHKLKYRINEKYFSEFEKLKGLETLPYNFHSHLEEFKTFSLKEKTSELDQTEFGEILEVIGCNKPISMNGITSGLIQKNSEWQDIVKKLNQPQADVEYLVSGQLIEEIKNGNVSTYRLTLSGLLLLLYHLYYEMDPELTTSIEDLRDAKILLSPKKQKLLKKTNSILQNNFSLFPEIFSKNNQEKFRISNYYLCYLLVLIYFDTTEKFFFENNLTKYLQFSRMKKLDENDSLQRTQKFYDFGKDVLTELVKKRETDSCFVSNVYDNVREKIEEDSEKFFQNELKKWIDEVKKLEKREKQFRGTRLYSHYSSFYERKLKNKPVKGRIENHDIAEAIISLPSYYENIFKEMPDFVTKKLFQYDIEHDFSDIGYHDNIKEKILFDLVLAYKEIESENWEKIKNQIKINGQSLCKWHETQLNELSNRSVLTEVIS